MRGRVWLMAVALLASAAPQGAEGGSTRRMVCRTDGERRVIYIPKSCESTYAAYARTETTSVRGSISVTLQNLQLKPEISGTVVQAKTIQRLGDLYDQLTSQQRMQLTAFCQARLMDPCDRELQRTTDDRVEQFGKLLAKLRLQIETLASATAADDAAAAAAAVTTAEDSLEEALYNTDTDASGGEY